MMVQKTTQKSFILAPVLLIILFAAVSFASIQLIKQDKIPTMANDTAWMQAYLSRDGSVVLSKKQQEIIQNSASITSAVAEDAGVKVTLRSVFGNGFRTYYKLDVELPEGMNTAEGDSFETCKLNLNDNRVLLSQDSSSFSTLEDGNPADQSYSCLLTTGFRAYPGFNYQFDNGIVRTLHLENLRLTSENGTKSKVIEGEWNFGILFHDEGKLIELLREPILVRGYSYMDYTSYEMKVTPYEAEIGSLVLTECSLYCDYQMTPNSKQESVACLRPIVIMTDGRTVRAGSHGGGNDSYRWDFPVPISLDEVAFVALTDDVVLPLPKNSL